MKYIAIVLVFVGIAFAGVPPLANAQETMTNQELTALVFSLQARIETLESMLNVQAQVPQAPQAQQATSTQAITQTITPPRISTPSIFDVARCRGSLRCAKP